MTDFSRNALVVEGGGMRGAFTSGVLDAFLQQRFNPFGLYVGVSSGSTNVANYLAGQQGRTLTFYIDHSLRSEFIDYKRFFKGGDLLDLKWMWEIGEQEHPLDQQSLFAKNPDFYMVLTHAKTGHAEYLRAGKDNLLNALRASSSIPVLTRHPVDIMGEPYFDGGVADALPVRWAAQQSGVKKLLVYVLVRKTTLKSVAEATNSLRNMLLNTITVLQIVCVTAVPVIMLQLNLFVAVTQNSKF